MNLWINVLDVPRQKYLTVYFSETFIQAGMAPVSTLDATLLGAPYGFLYGSPDSCCFSKATAWAAMMSPDLMGGYFLEGPCTSISFRAPTKKAML